VPVCKLSYCVDCSSDSDLQLTFLPYTQVTNFCRGNRRSAYMPICLYVSVYVRHVIECVSCLSVVNDQFDEAEKRHVIECVSCLSVVNDQFDECIS